MSIAKAVVCDAEADEVRDFDIQVAEISFCLDKILARGKFFLMRKACVKVFGMCGHPKCLFSLLQSAGSKWFSTMKADWS